jgi:hypothetical protein
MIALCIDCHELVEAGDDFKVVEPAPGSSTMREMCECVGNENCRGDDLHADDAYNDPRHIPYSNLRR